MVLESLINPFTAKKKPWDMFFLGFLYNSVAILLSIWIFESHSSLVMVFLTSIACIPLIFSTIKEEEEYDMKEKRESLLMKEHSKVLTFLTFLFLGAMLSVALWYAVLIPLFSNIFPSVFSASTHENLFSVQTETISNINYKITGGAIHASSILLKIFLNNLKVLMFCLLFSFFYGVGAIFILIWNASVIGVAIGNFITSNLARYSGYFSVVPIAILRYMTHGIFEITAYFAAGLAGGIISIAIIKHDLGTKNFEHVLLDSVDLILVAVGLLIVAALTEVFITPMFF